MKLSLVRGNWKSRWIITPSDRIPDQITMFSNMIIIKCSPLILLRPSILLIIISYTKVWWHRFDFERFRQFSRQEDRLSFACKGQKRNTYYFYFNHRIFCDISQIHTLDTPISFWGKTILENINVKIHRSTVDY